MKCSWRHFGQLQKCWHLQYHGCICSFFLMLWTASCLLPGQCKLQQRSVSVGCPMNLACGLLGCICCPHCFCWSLAIVGATTTKGHAQPQSQYLPGKSFTALVCGCRKKIMRSASYPASLTSSSRGCLHCHHTNL